MILSECINILKIGANFNFQKIIMLSHQTSGRAQRATADKSGLAGRSEQRAQLLKALGVAQAAINMPPFAISLHRAYKLMYQ